MRSPSRARSIFGLTGFGSALITIPLASHFVPLPFALALFALADLVSAFSVGLENPRNAVRDEWTRLVPMILAGTALGVTALVNLPRAVGMLLLGVFVLSFALYSLVRRPGSRVISAHWVWLAGFVGGITSTLFGAGGPPYVIYLSQRGLTKEQFRATLGFATMTSISLRVLAFLVTGLLLDLRGLDCRRGRGARRASPASWCRGACFGSSRATCCCAP